jgi:hypothetical protein
MIIKDAIASFFFITILIKSGVEFAMWADK